MQVHKALDAEVSIPKRAEILRTRSLFVCNKKQEQVSQKPQLQHKPYVLIHTCYIDHHKNRNGMSQNVIFSNKVNRNLTEEMGAFPLEISKE